MNSFELQDVKIAHDDEDEGDPIILLCGFAADGRSNWQMTGWTRLLWIVPGHSHLACITEGCFKAAVMGFPGNR